MENNSKQFLQIHYYFNDESHSMDAFVRNGMEKDILNFVTELGNLLGIEIQLESQAKTEGGLEENLIVVCGIAGIIASYFAPSINDIITFYFTGQNKSQEIEIKLKQEELKQAQIKTEKEKLELQNFIEEKSKNLNESSKIKRCLSNFYQKAEKYEKIQGIGYQTDKNAEEKIIKRNEFKNFILSKKVDKEVLEDVEIEIISPVLKEGRYKWRGVYKNEKIDFNMSDKKFKTEVIEQKYNFSNGSVINCQLEIKKTFDEYGEQINNTLYGVKKVFSIRTNEIIKKTKAGIKREKKQIEDKQRSLFDDE